jgi:hypothetical protein
MPVTPALNVTRFAQLNPGELFMFRHEDGACVGFAVCDPAQNDEKLLLPLGPNLPNGARYATLISARGFTTISFGGEFTVRLPTQADAWVDSPPPHDQHCILVAGDRPYFRANYAHDESRFVDCYVDIADGRIFTAGSGAAQQIATPRGIAAYAIKWKLVTNEGEPRVILAYPFV